jgi:hypothetical protein
MLVVAHLTLIQKRDVCHTDVPPFVLPRPTWYRTLVPPRLLEHMLISF